MLLVIESLGERGPNGHRALSIAHYGERNGDAGIRDLPRLCWRTERVALALLLPQWCWRQRLTAIGVDGSMTCQPQTRDLSFMEMWDANIHHQGFLEAFSGLRGRVRFAGFVAHSRVNGLAAGRRLLQGCNLGCTGCWNPATHHLHSRRASRRRCRTGGSRT
jgi:hypothetical protein